MNPEYNENDIDMEEMNEVRRRLNFDDIDDIEFNFDDEHIILPPLE